MKYVSSFVYEPEQFPGVKVHIAKLSASRRTQVNMQTADANREIRELGRKGQELQKQKDSISTEEFSIREESLVSRLNYLSNNVLMPAYVQTFVRKVEGLELLLEDESTPVDITAETLLNEAPSDLLDLVYNKIRESLELTAEEVKN